MNTEKLQFQWDGETMEFESFTNCLSRVTAETILNGRTYPVVPFVRDVNVVMDIGANVGAAASEAELDRRPINRPDF